MRPNIFVTLEPDTSCSDDGKNRAPHNRNDLKRGDLIYVYS